MVTTLKIISVLLCFAVCICTIFSFASCSKYSPSTSSVLQNLIDCEIGLPSGNIYLSEAPEGSANYTNDSLIASLYGDGSKPVESDEWIEFAIFLSNTHHPCEFGVFLCKSAQAASDTSKMLCRRLDTLKNSWSGTKYASYTDNASVTVSGNFCFLLISSDTKQAKSTALSAIH